MSAGKRISEQIEQQCLEAKNRKFQEDIQIYTEFAAFCVAYCVKEIRHTFNLEAQQQVIDNLASAVNDLRLRKRDDSDKSNDAVLGCFIVNERGFILPQIQFYLIEDFRSLGVSMGDIENYARDCNSTIKQLLPTCISEACLLIRISRVLGFYELETLEKRSKLAKIVSDLSLLHLHRLKQAFEGLIQSKIGERVFVEENIRELIRCDMESFMEDREELKLDSQKYSEHSFAETSTP